MERLVIIQAGHHFYFCPSTRTNTLPVNTGIFVTRILYFQASIHHRQCNSGSFFAKELIHHPNRTIIRSNFILILTFISLSLSFSFFNFLCSILSRTCCFRVEFRSLQRTTIVLISPRGRWGRVSVAVISGRSGSWQILGEKEETRDCRSETVRKSIHCTLEHRY